MRGIRSICPDGQLVKLNTRKCCGVADCSVASGSIFSEPGVQTKFMCRKHRLCVQNQPGATQTWTNQPEANICGTQHSPGARCSDARTRTSPSNSSQRVRCRPAAFKRMPRTGALQKPTKRRAKTHQPKRNRGNTSTPRTWSTLRYLDLCPEPKRIAKPGIATKIWQTYTFSCFEHFSQNRADRSSKMIGR